MLLPNGWVPERVLWMVDESNNNIMGSISIGHRLIDNLKFRGGQRWLQVESIWILF